MQWREYIAHEYASQVNCTVPNSSDARAAWHFRLDFDCDSVPTCVALAAASNMSLTGNAEFHEGQLRLTRAGHPSLSAATEGYENQLQPVLPGAEDATRPDTLFEHGAAILTLPSGTHALQLHVEFTVIVGGGLDGGGEGFAVSYGGGLPNAMGEFGGGIGLRVQFLSGSSDDGEGVVGPRVLVEHDGMVLGQVQPLDSLRAERPIAVAITADSAGVSVRYNGRVLFDRLGWGSAGFVPQPEWQLAFSAACAARPDNHWIDDLFVETGTRVADTPVAVSVALNGQQFVDIYDSLGFTFDTSRPPPPSPPPAPPSLPPENPPHPPHPPLPRDPPASPQADGAGSGSGDASSGVYEGSGADTASGSGAADTGSGSGDSDS